jgi:hypothetical protein
MPCAPPRFVVVSWWETLMSRDNVDVENLQVTGAEPVTGADASLTVTDGVLIVVNQAYGPTGESLVGVGDVKFDGYPAVTLLVKAGDREELVYLSPIHGDKRKKGLEDLEPGTKCELLCPVSKTPLDRIGSVVDGGDADYYAIYLTPKLEKGSMIYVSDVWGHHHSRIVDNNELISYWATAEEGAA